MEHKCFYKLVNDHTEVMAFCKTCGIHATFPYKPSWSTPEYNEGMKPAQAFIAEHMQFQPKGFCGL